MSSYVYSNFKLINDQPFVSIDFLEEKLLYKYWINTEGVIYYQKEINGKFILNKRKPVQKYYPHISMRLEKGGKIWKTIHGLLARTFLMKNHEDYKKYDLVVNHIDGNKSNSRLSNIELVSSSENTIHSYRYKLQKCKIDEPAVKKIIKLRKQNYSIARIAEVFNVSNSTICWILSNRTKKYMNNEILPKRIISKTNDPRVIARVIELEKEGHSQMKISEIITSEGTKISQYSIYKIFKKINTDKSGL